MNHRKIIGQKILDHLIRLIIPLTRNLRVAVSFAQCASSKVQLEELYAHVLVRNIVGQCRAA